MCKIEIYVHKMYKGLRNKKKFGNITIQLLAADSQWMAIQVVIIHI